MASIWAKPEQDAIAAQRTQLALSPEPSSTVWATPDDAPAMIQTAKPQVVEPTPEQREIGATQKALQKVQWNQEHPWGTPENHPGKLGKVAHVFSTLGNIAGDIFAPGVMARIPGTQLNMQMREGELANRLREETGAESLNAARGAEEKNIESQIKEREQPKYTPLSTDEGYQNYDPRSGNVQPLNDASGSPLMPHDPFKAASRITLKGPNGEPVPGFVDPYTHQVSDIQGNLIPNPVLYQKEGTPPHITAMVGGKPHIMERDPATGQYSIDRGEAPPNYAMVAPQLKTFNTKDENGNNVVKTLAGKTVGEMPDTSTTRTMSEMASTVLPQLDSVKGEIKQLADSVGPAVGRWNQLMVNKGGADFPEFAGLDTDLDLLASAIVRTHFGARGGQEYRQELRKMFGEAQSPEDLMNRLDHADSWIMGYARAGGHAPQKTAAPAGGGFRVNLKDAMALPQNNGKSEAEVEADVKKHGGTVVR
jgi:hypothetical protein